MLEEFHLKIRRMSLKDYPQIKELMDKVFGP